MDFKNIYSGMIRSKIFSACVFFYTFISFAFAQLSQSDLNFIHKTVLTEQDETTGLFGKSYITTFKSIQILKLLGENIPNQSKICRDLGYELSNPIRLEYVEVNNLLNCKNEFTNLENLKEENFQNLNLASLYERILILNKLNMKINWKNIQELLLAFQDGDALYANVKNGYSSLSSTVQALHLLANMYKDLSVEEDLKEDIKTSISTSFTNMLKEFQLLKDVNILFFIFIYT